MVILYWKKFQVNKMAYQMKRRRDKNEDKPGAEAMTTGKLNENIVYFYVASEKSKPECEESINDEYMQKVILYGYVMVDIETPIILLYSDLT